MHNLVDMSHMYSEYRRQEMPCEECPVLLAIERNPEEQWISFIFP